MNRILHAKTVKKMVIRSRIHARAEFEIHWKKTREESWEEWQKIQKEITVDSRCNKNGSNNL
jgi:hypothetical protein